MKDFNVINPFQKTGDFPDAGRDARRDVRRERGGPLERGVAAAAQRPRRPPQGLPAELPHRGAALQPAATHLERQEHLPSVAAGQVRPAPGQGHSRSVD